MSRRPVPGIGSGFSHRRRGRRWSRYNEAVIEILAVVAATVTDMRCPQVPEVKAEGFRHKRTKLIAKTGSSNHRGIDLLANETDARQVIAGKLAYGKFDKDAEDEDAEIFACVDNAWKSLGVARSNDDGRFKIELSDAARLPVGMRDMYVAARADGTGAY